MSDAGGRFIHKDCSYVFPCWECIKRAEHNFEWPEHEGVPISFCERDRISSDGP